MSKATAKKHVIDAIATYICIEAKRNNRFTMEVDTNDIGTLLSATEEQKETAHRRAREILRDFI